MYLNTISTELPTVSHLLPICWPYSLSSHRTAENTAFFVFATPVVTSPVIPSSHRPLSRLRLASRPVFASPVAPSSPRGRAVFTSPVAPSSPRGRAVFTSPVAPSSPRPSPRLRLARRPFFASPVVPSPPRPSSRLRLARRPVSASPVVPSPPRPVFASWPRRLRHPYRPFVTSWSPRLRGMVVFCFMFYYVLQINPLAATLPL
ncbi:uncharacterized protein LOC130690624 [Daphnia carinata]|uniref:uncharacterized protein LOC130690624 n=1 Tax=Daphnia carinata TaxID=120202 RepID=UPI00286846B2|nr:uncharacterized protein LOC130690624 [Daphnia carinata]